MGFTEQNGVLTFTPSPDKPPAKSWIARHKVATGVLAVLAPFIVVGVAGGIEGAKQPSSSSSPQTSTLGAADKAAAAVKGAEVTSYATSNLEITFPIHDNISDGLRRAGVARDTFALLEALKVQDVVFDRVTVNGTFDMVDSYGAVTKAEHVFNADFDHATVNRIQYDNITTTELDALERFAMKDKTGDALIWLHPAFGWQR